jgi:hypothetical protein
MNYAYSPDTGELINTTNPAPWMGTTTVAPPAFNPAAAGCFWRNGAWVVVTADQLTPAKATQIAVLASAYAVAIQQPVSFTSAGNVTKTYQADQGSISNLQNSILGFQKALATPTGFYWVAADNTQVPFTYADLQGLAAAMLAQGWTAFQHLQVQKAAVSAATTIVAVQAVVW